MEKVIEFLVRGWMKQDLVDLGNDPADVDSSHSLPVESVQPKLVLVLQDPIQQMKANGRRQKQAHGHPRGNPNPGRLNHIYEGAHAWAEPSQKASSI